MVKVRATTALLVLAACVALPPVGVWLAGNPLASLYEFPPPLDIPEVPPFNWWSVPLVGLAAALIASPLIIRGPGAAYARREKPAGRRAGFPHWGLAALAWTAVWWIIAWTRIPWLSFAQEYTFTPLWIGFIVLVNALTFSRSGGCLMLANPALFARLFLASAAFWWLFEHLNRFVRNWHYLGLEDVGATEYAVHASLCFSTVLPAVASVRELLGTFHPLGRWLANGPRGRWLGGTRAGYTLIATGLAGLLATGFVPDLAYPALWTAPLLLAVGISLARKIPGWWNNAAAGDWQEAGLWMIAALVCGFFWELWNLHSFAKWIYTVPYAHRWELFEMPALGYAGYLPFGLECAIAVSWCATAADARNGPAGSP